MDKKVCLLYAMTIILAVSFNVFIVKYVCPQMMAEKIECFKSTDNIYICTELDEKLWAGLKTGLENNIGGDVIWLQEKEKILDSEEMIIPIDSNIVIDIIINNMTLWGFVVEMWVMLLFITELYFLRMSNKKEKFIDEVERLKYDTYEENYKDVIGILERIDLNTENKKENEEYLGVLHRIFCELEKKLMREIDEKEKYMMSIKEYDEVKELKEKQKVIKDTIEQIKDMAKAKKIQNQKEIMQKVTMNVKELSKNSNI